jgi:hypothetical protein
MSYSSLKPFFGTLGDGAGAVPTTLGSTHQAHWRRARALSHPTLAIAFVTIINYKPTISLALR